MARSRDSDVRAIISTDANLSISPFIEAATILVDRVATCATARSETLTTDQLHIIETYLAAHFYAHRDPQYQEKQTEKASAVFQGKTGMGLESTYWGQTAMTLDTSGCLASFGRGTRASLNWLGKAPSDQIDYIDRD